MSDPTRSGFSRSPTTFRCHGCGKPHVGELLPSDWRVHRTVRGLVFCPSCATWNVGSWR
jgi:hypothetical protein